MENEKLTNNNNEISQNFSASSGTGVMSSLIFVALMIIFMVILAKFMN